ncbi:hypothetical protein [Georgfuchsia toluolica]|uniref:hypothetical protein n=1 Tax=Georgfuchsia toluolica TaxID=424218 RepID=UPI001C72E2A1|nr:hypothetical protein [Georgfuchsia toluolica]
MNVLQQVFLALRCATYAENEKMIRIKKYLLCVFIPIFILAGTVQSVRAQVGLTEALIASVALHGAVLFWKFYSDYTNPYADSTSGAPSGSPVLQVQINPKAPLDTPSGWTAPVAPSIQPAAPTIPKQNTYDVVGGTLITTKSGFASATDAGNYWAASLTALGGAVFTACNGGLGVQYPGSACMAAYPGSTCSGSNSCVNTNTSSCPTGYTASGSNCVPATPGNQWKPSDGKCVWLRVPSSGWSADAYDPDCLPTNKQVVKSTNTLTITSPDGNTQTVFTLNTSTNVATITRTSNNGLYTQQETATTSVPDGTTGATTVTGTTLQTASGAGSTVGTYSNGTANAVAPSGSGTSTDMSGVTSRLDTIHNDLNTNPSALDGSLSGAITDYNSKATDHNNAISAIGTNGGSNEGGALQFDGLPTPPSTNGTCTDRTFTIGTVTRTLTGWCDAFAKIRDVFGYVMYISTAFGLFHIVVRPKEA